MISMTNMRTNFAYGSNINEEQMRRRCPHSSLQGKATLPGYQFFINKRGVASIRRKPGKQVWGLIYTLTQNDEDSLDSHEGVPKYYTKKDLPELNAFCYIGTSTTENPKSPPGRAMDSPFLVYGARGGT